MHDLADMRDGWYQTLALEATGYADEASYLSGGYDITEGEVLAVLRSCRVPMTQPLREDLDRIARGDGPRFFISFMDAADRYRRRLGIPNDTRTRHIVACRAEQEAFYASEEWDGRAKVARVAQGIRPAARSRPGAGSPRRMNPPDPAAHLAHLMRALPGTTEEAKTR